MLTKLKEFVKQYHSDITMAVAVICITVISFNLGRISAGERSHAKLAVIGPSARSGSTAKLSSPTAIPTPRDLRVVASKASTSKAYHFLWCSGAKRIAEKNKLTFPTEEAAKTAGYTLAGNCQQ